jgi:hypothetical protein
MSYVLREDSDLLVGLLLGEIRRLRDELRSVDRERGQWREACSTLRGELAHLKNGHEAKP